MKHTVNKENTEKALKAALDCVGYNDFESAVGYLAVAAAELCGNPRPGQTLISQTADSYDCVRRGEIDNT